MSDKLVKVEQPELLQVVKESKIDLTRAEAYALNYAPFMSQVHELSQPLKELEKTNPEHAKVARKQRLAMVKVRTAAEAKKKSDKETIVIEGRLIDSLFNVVKNTSMLTESEYEEIEKYAEKVEADRIAKLKEDRIKLLEPYGTDTTYIALDQMGEEQFNTLLDREKQGYEARLAAEKKAEEDRIAAEKKAEEERLEREKKEAEERERIRIENERLKKEAEEREAQLKKEREAAAKEQAEKDRLAEIERKKQAAEQAKKDAEIAELKRKEDERISAENKAKQQAEEKERAAKLAPDKEKINALFLSIKGFEFPEVEDDAAKKIISDVKEGFKIILDGIKSAAKEIK